MNKEITNTPIENTAENAALMRIRNASFVVLEIHTDDTDGIRRLLEEKIREGGDFLQQIPMVLDFTKFDGEIGIEWLEELCTLLSDNQIMSVGVIGVSEDFAKEVLACGITVWPSRKSLGLEQAKEMQGEEAAEEIAEREEHHREPPPPSRIPEENGCRASRIIGQPVRSGQRIYAKGADLILLSAVNAGAEVMADGNIHVYGTLRGRAIAGSAGWEGARIFCQNLQAELIAIAGYYTTNEDLPREKQNMAVKISLQKGSLEIEPLVA